MINKLVEKIQKMNAPIVVGLDPMMKFVPEHITKKAFEEYQKNNWVQAQMPTLSYTQELYEKRIHEQYKAIMLKFIGLNHRDMLKFVRKALPAPVKD